MIPVTDHQLFLDSLRELSAYKTSVGRHHKGRFSQIFLALKFYQNQLPSMFSGQFVSTGVLQTMLDDLYAKASRRADDCVLMLFRGTYLARTGLRSGRRGPENTWRNNFNLQKGIGCYAPTADLQSQVFLDQSRSDCRYLQPVQPGVLAYGRCALCPAGATYRNEDHRKWLQINASGDGYSVLDLLNVGNYAPYVAPNGRRIPIIPLIVALYYDASPALITGTRAGGVDIADFAADFNFSSSEIAVYFDDEANNPHNSNLLRAYPGVIINPIGHGQAQPILPARPQAARPARVAGTPLPVLTGTRAAPPAVNTGWEAEQFVAAVLSADGWDVHDLTRQKVGYDLLAQRRRRTLFIDVKSSVGLCSPTLTAREWEQAHMHGADYILAIIENFSPTSMNVVYWVPDPAGSCQARACTVTQYGIARGSWTSATVPFQSI